MRTALPPQHHTLQTTYPCPRLILPTWNSLTKLVFFVLGSPLWPPNFEWQLPVITKVMVSELHIGCSRKFHATVHHERGLFDLRGQLMQSCARQL